MNPLDALRIAMSSVEAFYKERGIFQGRFGFGKKPALVVIDMAYGWTDAAYAGGSARLETAVAAIQKILPAARAKSVPVFYTTSAVDRPQRKSAADYSPKFRTWDRHACAIDERLAPAANELVLAKEYASAFAGTPLIGHLVAHGVDTLLITGCSTSACVRATATDAKTFHLRPIIIREAVQDRSEIAHEFTLCDIQARFADVVSMDETLSFLASLGG